MTISTNEDGSKDKITDKFPSWVNCKRCSFSYNDIRSIDYSIVSINYSIGSVYYSIVGVKYSIGILNYSIQIIILI